MPMGPGGHGVPIKRLRPLGPLLRLWHRRVLPLAKVFGLVCAAALGLTHVSHDVLITALPPLAGASYWGLRRWRLRLVARLLEGPKLRLVIRQYDELDVRNVRRGVENAYDSFVAQTLEAVEQRMVGFLESAARRTSAPPGLVDENGQVTMRLGAVETFVVVDAARLVKLSFALHLRHRQIGTVEVAMVERGKSGAETTYDVGIVAHVGGSSFAVVADSA